MYLFATQKWELHCLVSPAAGFEQKELVPETRVNNCADPFKSKLNPSAAPRAGHRPSAQQPIRETPAVRRLRASHHRNPAQRKAAALLPRLPVLVGGGGRAAVPAVRVRGGGGAALPRSGGHARDGGFRPALQLQGAPRLRLLQGRLLCVRARHADRSRPGGRDALHPGTALHRPDQLGSTAAAGRLRPAADARPLCLDSQRTVGYLGWCRHPVLMHLSAANMAIWLRMLIWDGAETWLRHTHTFAPNPTSHSLDKEGRHSVHVSYDCSWQVQTPDAVEDLLRLRSCYRNSTLGVIFAEARPFVTPFIFQYCIAAAALQYALWKSPPSKLRPPSRLLQSSQSQQRMDCRGSSKGLFLGLLVLAVGIVALILYFVLAHNPGLKEETLLVLVCTHSGLLLLALLASLFGICRVGGMCARADKDPCSTLHQILQNVGLCALFVQSGCALVAALQDVSRLVTQSSDGHQATVSTVLSQSGSVFITMADATLCIAHALVQTLLFHRIGQRRCKGGCPHEESRPGRQVVTFLAFCNLVLWVTDTFAGGRDQATSQLQVQLFGALPWQLITQLTMPLVMLYRFQSTVFLLEAWNSGYGTDSK
ncbi:proton channel OtopLc [Caerostris extrusa]|uniref:Proton channel OtopLc n=1 Tax=Caerostris extrusa TaxID=172846 RepID=A0AAV4RAF6_CAEEX|nr:proton channel OtopLc [Caerostris extrusa]